MTKAQLEYRIVAVVAIIVLLAVGAAFVNVATATVRTPEPEPQSTWVEYRQAQEAFDEEVGEFLADLRESESKGETVNLMGDFVARAIDHAVWSVDGIYWDDCYRDYAQKRGVQLTWLVTFLSAHYHNLTAIVGDPVSNPDQVGDVLGVYSAIADQALTEVTCEETT